MTGDDVTIETNKSAKYVGAIQVGDGPKCWLEADQAIEIAATLVDLAILRCSPELRQKFNNLVRDIQR